MTLEEHFQENGHLFEAVKRVWQPDQLAYAYLLYNLITGENRGDTGCGSCRRAVIAKVRGTYLKWKQDQEKKSS
jgi:hypothetical protein